MPYTYYDIGLNLFTKSFPHPEKIIEDAHAAGIQCILTGSEAEENELVNDFTKTHDVYGTAGIHPHSADEAKEEDVARIEEILTTNPRILAVGETGLDYDRMYSRKENQIHYFKESRSSFTSGMRRRTSSPALPVTKPSVRAPSSTATRGIRKRSGGCSIWASISASPDGSAMSAARMTCARPSRSFRWIA